MLLCATLYIVTSPLFLGRMRRRPGALSAYDVEFSDIRFFTFSSCAVFSSSTLIFDSVQPLRCILLEFTSIFSRSSTALVLLHK